MWELAVCVDGVNYANNPEKNIEPPTDAEFEEMLMNYDHLRATVN